MSNKKTRKVIFPKGKLSAQEAVDAIASIVCKEKQDEIDQLREYISGIRDDAFKIMEKMGGWMNVDHEFYDFCESIDSRVYL